MEKGDNVMAQNDESTKRYDCRLTTIDNPFDPFDDFDKWYAWDEAHGYHTSEYLAKVLQTSDNFSAEDQASDTEKAIDEIVQLNLTGKYIKVTREWSED